MRLRSLNPAPVVESAFNGSMAARTEIPPSEGRGDAGGGDAAHSIPVEPSGAAEGSGLPAGPKSTSLNGWFAELKRRRVFRALVGYGIGAFAVLQIIEPIVHPGAFDLYSCSRALACSRLPPASFTISSCVAVAAASQPK